MGETDQTFLEIIEENAPKTGTSTGALLIVAPVVPIIAVITSIVTFVVPTPTVKVPDWLNFLSWLGPWLGPWIGPVVPLLVGTGAALLLWLLLAWFYYPFTTVYRADEKSYHALLEHLSTLDYYLDAWLSEDTKKATLCMLERATVRMSQTTKPEQSSPVQSTGAASGQTGGGTQALGSTSGQASVAAQGSGTTPGSAGGGTQVPGTAPAQPSSSKDSCALDPIQEMLHYRNALCLTLMQRSTSWVMGHGYSALWDLMDSAEEALIMVAPQEKVVGDAVYDEMRLNDSKIENSQEWTNKLRSAVKMLDPGAEGYLIPIRIRW